MLSCSGPLKGAGPGRVHSGLPPTVLSAHGSALGYGQLSGQAGLQHRGSPSSLRHSEGWGRGRAATGAVGLSPRPLSDTCVLGPYSASRQRLEGSRRTLATNPFPAGAPQTQSKYVMKIPLVVAFTLSRVWASSRPSSLRLRGLLWQSVNTRTWAGEGRSWVHRRPRREWPWGRFLPQKPRGASG